MARGGKRYTIDLDPEGKESLVKIAHGAGYKSVPHLVNAIAKFDVRVRSHPQGKELTARVKAIQALIMYGDLESATILAADILTSHKVDEAIKVQLKSMVVDGIMSEPMPEESDPGNELAQTYP